MELDLGGFGRFEADLSSSTLFRRCANCPTTPPPCPACAPGTVCSLIAGGCDTCPVVMCQPVGGPTTATPTPSSSNSGPSGAGPIAGGVIGGIAFVCIVTFLFWRFCIKKRLAARQRQLYEDWQNAAAFDEKDDYGYDNQRDTLASRQSVRSIASTVLTRASNVIQIAYIPGVTNRSVESTPDLVPPVPPIPAASPYHSTSSTPTPSQDQHFFMPSDLRDSTYSDYTIDRASYARSSLAQSVGRGSVPSTAYRGSAIVHSEPAQTAIRGKANPVAVKLTGKNSPSDTPPTHTPPGPVMQRGRYAPRYETVEPHTTGPMVARLAVPRAVTLTKPSSNGNLRATAALDKASQPASAPQASLGPERKPSVTESGRHNGDSSTFDDASSSDEESAAERSLMGHERTPQFLKSSPNAPTFRSPASAPDLHHASHTLASSSSSTLDGHAAKFASKERKQRHKRSGSLNQIIEEAARRASKEPRHGGLGSVGSVLGNYDRELRGSKEGPFSDAHVAGTP